MLRFLVLPALLAVGTQAFLEIRWGGNRVGNFVLTPAALLPPSDGKAQPEMLMISDDPDGMHGSRSPSFSVREDGRIAWGETSWCVDANGKDGVGVSINHCTGSPSQLWSVDSKGHGHMNQIRLKSTNKCIDVNDNLKSGLNGAPVELRECAGKVTESWIFEEQIHPSTSSDFVRHLAISCAAMAVLSAMSLRTWLRRSRRPPLAFASAQGGPSSSMDQGGVDLAAQLFAQETCEHLTQVFEMTVDEQRVDMPPDHDGLGAEAILVVQQDDSGSGEDSKSERLRPRLRPRVVMAAVEIDGESLQFFDEDSKNDSQIVLRAVQQNGLDLQYASEEMRSNITIVSAAIQQNPMALQFAADMLQNDNHLVLTAVEQNGDALKFAGDGPRNDCQVVQQAVRNNGEALQYAGDGPRDTEQVVVNAVRKSPLALRFAGEKSKNTDRIVLTAVRHDFEALELAGKDLQQRWYELSKKNKFSMDKNMHSLWQEVLEFRSLLQKRPFAVGSLSFDSIADVRWETTRMIRSYANTAVLDPSSSDYELIAALLEFHPASAEKKKNMVGLKIAPSGRGNTRCFWVMKAIGYEEDFSVVKCIDALANTVSNGEDVGSENFGKNSTVMNNADSVDDVPTKAHKIWGDEEILTWAQVTINMANATEKSHEQCTKLRERWQNAKPHIPAGKRDKLQAMLEKKICVAL